MKAQAPISNRRPALPQAEIDRLIALYSAGQFAQVVTGAETLAARHAPSLTLSNIAGAACVALADFVGAERAFRHALGIESEHAELHNNLGAALEPQGKLDEAAASYARALTLKPDHASGHFNLGNVRRKQHDIAGAIACYQRAIALQPDYVEAYNNLGRALIVQKDAPAAAQCLQRALAIRPDYPDAFNNLGHALKAMGDPEQAMACYQHALSLKPGCTISLNNIAAALMDARDYHSAIQVFDILLGAEPDNFVALRQRTFAQMQICDFSAIRDLPAPSRDGDPDAGEISPFVMLPVFDDPAQQLAYSRQWAQAALRLPAAPQAAPARPSDQRIRIGYFSADFHNHATLYLMAGLFREHDRTRFEIIAYSYGDLMGTSAGKDEARNQLIEHVDRFIDLSEMQDADIVALVHGDALDIAVDLKGYTERSRSHLFSARLAPVQIAYLGYPGSMGTDYIDYLIADPNVIPASSRPFYSEKIVYLPGSYQPNDDRRPIAQTGRDRADFGLPHDGFVFCCFNHTYKIGPREFAIWMRALQRVEGSVLWLLGSNAWAENNLRHEAAARGVDPARLIFAEALPHSEHLARLRLADLFIDTFNVNAHTTASDALWAGLPVVTLAGRQFAARVGASLLHAVGLPELVTDSEEAYETLIARLAGDPAELAAVRARLQRNRLDQPLFDTRLYAEKIESAFTALHQRRLLGLEPADMAIA